MQQGKPLSRANEKNHDQKYVQLLPFERLTEIMRDLFACRTFSEGLKMASPAKKLWFAP